MVIVLYILDVSATFRRYNTSGIQQREGSRTIWMMCLEHTTQWVKGVLTISSTRSSALPGAQDKRGGQSGCGERVDLRDWERTVPP